ncbi:hypothetical protein [Chitinophaga sancti]|uniref:Uncharacterized protein n=1 Tax=Chitinophaga sancti TaxID=1004 RepID=A0A1K1LPL3_9BACT|nr:hypothetical protein [Chitinophaga sancti]WQD64952.1 hypothetical protein U0033_11155 [Chitinophaga sancti]WQG89424.1 hypothetical protein SR876_31315 [Chitinophaga sancti]SFW12818.1 hypothetical protein SAMN05661012_00109 [Chitinophaga sancti]
MIFDTKEVTWANMKVVLLGKELTGIRGIKYKLTQEKEHLHGAGDQPIGIQRGKRTYEGEIKLLKFEYDILADAVARAGGRDILDLTADIVVTYVKDSLSVPRTDIIQGFQFKEFEKGWEQGAKFMELTLPILFMGLKQNA